MLKAFIVSFALLIALVLVIWSGVLELIVTKTSFYIALCLLAVVVIMAFVILGNPLNGLKDDEKKND